MGGKNRASVAIITKIQPSRLAATSEHFIKRRVKFHRAIDSFIMIVINQQVSDVVDHHDLLQRVLRDGANGGGHRQNCRMIRTHRLR